MITSFIYIFIFILAAFSGFCSLWIVNKFSTGHTPIKSLVNAAIAMEIATFILILLKIPFGNLIALGFGMYIVSKITSIRGIHLFFAILLYGGIRVALLVSVASLFG